MQSTPYGRLLFIDLGCSLESAERTSTQVTRRANRKKRLTVLYIVEHPNQEGDTCIDWTSQYCRTNGWNCLWRGHSVYRNRPLIPREGRWGLGGGWGGLGGKGGGRIIHTEGGAHTRRGIHKAVHTQGGLWPPQESCYLRGHKQGGIHRRRCTHKAEHTKGGLWPLK